MAETWKKLVFDDEVIAPPAGAAQGEVLYYSGTAWVKLAVGTDGHQLTTHGAGADPTWAAGAGLSADSVKDTHIDWGAGADQVDADDVPASATKFWAGEAGADVTANNAPKAHKDSHDPSGGDPLDTAAAAEIAGVQAAAEGSAETFARSDHAHQIQASIADDHIVTVDDATPPTDGEVAVFTANGVEGQTPAEVAATMALDDIGDPDAAVGFSGQQATDLLVHSVADAANRPTPVIAKICHQQDDDHLYLCTVAI